LAVLAAVAGLCVAAVNPWKPSTPQSSKFRVMGATPVVSANWYASAPYDFVTDPGGPDLGKVLDATGQKAFVLAFIRAPTAGGCIPTWAGTDPVSTDTRATEVIRQVRAHGGDVSVAVGGGSGTALGLECGTPQATADAYRSVLDKYGIHVIDFDIEQTESESRAAVANEMGAARILQREIPGLVVTITIPSTPTGVDTLDERVLVQARVEGITVAAYTIMPFDDDFHGTAAQQRALTDFNRQLSTLFGWSTDVAWQHEGISQMNGQTDTGEYFSEADFQSNLDFAESHQMARYTYWSMNRDRECTPPSNHGQLSTECSSIPQSAYAFTRYDSAFARWMASDSAQ
jgi:chitinase